MAKDPAFLFYSNDFDVATKFFSHEQVGKYLRLLITQHQHGHLSEQQMKFICGSYDKEVYARFKQDESGLFYNERLENELIKRSEFSKSRSENRKGKTKKTKKKSNHKNTSKSYEISSDFHMENENENENRIETEIETENLNPKRKTKKSAPIENPFTLEFHSGPWQTWKEYRVEINKPIKPMSENEALRELHRMSGGDESIADKIIRQSIAQGWTGLFDLKNSHGSGGTPTHQPETPTQTDDITRIIDEFNVLTQSQYDPADESIRGFLAGRLMDGCQLQDMLDVIALKAVQWGSNDSRKFLKFHTLFKPEKYSSYVQEVRDAKSGKIKVHNENETPYERYSRFQRGIDHALAIIEGRQPNPAEMA